MAIFKINQVAQEEEELIEEDVEELENFEDEEELTDENLDDEDLFLDEEESGDEEV